MARVVRTIMQADILGEAHSAQQQEAEDESDEAGGEALAERERSDGRSRGRIHVTPTVFTLKMGFSPD
jgi:hypothetical protein